ncbi:Dolichyl-phosphate-mannose-protein mannosyltransferase [Haloarchaeobius iranensis]|uniref:Dolichyl-phosphate-mannose-protein mannosyltransferase n=1 Tax=Haloarchaeobius iranensis TaxID=996166 RepID=A0A1G9TVR9_9EURY|nr:Dolichyl-phosphate-mannose-protein mannosyltransferase [Haloarchaeobius iranensis]
MAGSVPDVLTRTRVPSLLLAALAAAVVFVVATELFPYHSANHDEGVYLHQASLLLDGQLYAYPPDGLTEAFRPWFFVTDGESMYPKYAPVPSAIFALGLALGEPRLSLAAVAAGIVALTAALGTEAFDRRVGLLAGVLVLLTPTFLLTTSVFLPYAPATLLNLAFALAYVRAHRRHSRRYAVLAGVAVALAFFARPYTAVLFALPFVGHACWTLATAYRRRDGSTDEYLQHGVVARNLVVAALGLVGVLTTLGYNWLLTGDPLVFPYAAFAPLDGLGFGQRRILEHDLVYTPALAVRTNLVLLWESATRWTVGGWLGTAAFLGGAGAWLVRRLVAPDSSPTLDRPHCSDDCLALLLLAVVPAVCVGNLAFWGTYNVSSGPSELGDGLLSLFGPLYHFDLVVPLATFGAFGVVTAADRLRAAVTARRSKTAARVVLAALLVVSLPAVGVAERDALDAPVTEHAETTEKYGTIYEPVLAQEFDDAVVFVPTPYGDWLAHPFQTLRNDAGYDGDVVYALDRGPTSDFAVLRATGDRTPYRFTYHGEWVPDATDRPIGKLERLELRSGEQLSGTTRVGVPRGASSAIVRLEGDGEVREFAVEGAVDGSLAANWTVGPDGLRLTDDDVQALGGDRSVPLNGTTEFAVAVVLTYEGGATLTYRQEFDARRTDDGVQVVWPPASSVCRLVVDCGLEGTYLPDHPDEHFDGVWLNGTLTTGASSENSITAPVQNRKRSDSETVRMDFPMAAPPPMGSSFVSPRRSSYSMGVSTTS